MGQASQILSDYIQGACPCRFHDHVPEHKCVEDYREDSVPLHGLCKTQHKGGDGCASPNMEDRDLAKCEENDRILWGSFRRWLSPKYWRTCLLWLPQRFATRQGGSSNIYQRFEGVHSWNPQSFHLLREAVVWRAFQEILCAEVKRATAGLARSLYCIVSWVSG